MSLSAADEQQLRQLLDRLAGAWDGANADAYGALFTEDASYVTFFGGFYRGRSEIVALHRALWAKGPLKGTRQFSEVIDLRGLTKDAAVIVGRGDVAKKTPRKLSKIQTFIATRQPDAGWLIAHFHNSKEDAIVRFMTYSFSPATVPSIDRKGG